MKSVVQGVTAGGDVPCLVGREGKQKFGAL